MVIITTSKSTRQYFAISLNTAQWIAMIEFIEIILIIIIISQRAYFGVMDETDDEHYYLPCYCHCPWGITRARDVIQIRRRPVCCNGGRRLQCWRRRVPLGISSLTRTHLHPSTQCALPRSFCRLNTAAAVTPFLRHHRSWAIRACARRRRAFGGGGDRGDCATTTLQYYYPTESSQVCVHSQTPSTDPPHRTRVVSMWIRSADAVRARSCDLPPAASPSPFHRRRLCSLFGRRAVTRVRFRTPKSDLWNGKREKTNITVVGTLVKNILQVLLSSLPPSRITGRGAFDDCSAEVCGSRK